MTYDALVYALFAASLALPALPAALELRSRRDASALLIDSDYASDARYLGKSFRRKIAPLLERATTGSQIAFLGRANEHALIVDAFDVPKAGDAGYALLSRGDVRTAKAARLTDVYSGGSVHAGSGASLRTIVADGDIRLDERVNISRWIDAEGDIRIGRGSTIARSASAGGTCTLASLVEFRRLFGNPIVIGAQSEQRVPPRIAGAFERDIISPRTVEIAAGRTHGASIKAGGDVVLRAGACVSGSIVARGNVRIERSAIVFGHVFSEGRISIAQDAVVGAPGHAKTVYASESICLSPGATIHGWIICEGRGTTL